MTERVRSESRRFPSRWALGTGVVVVAVVAATMGVMTSAGAAPHQKPVTQASAVTTATVSFNATITGLPIGTVMVTGTGAINLAGDAAALTVTLPANVAALLPGGSDGPETADVVLSGGTVYLEVPGLTALVGEPWVSVTLPASAAAAVPKLFAKASAGLGDVDAILSFAAKHHATVTSLGTSTVDGTTATGSQITASPHGASLNASVWADSSDRLVQATLSLTGSRSTGGSVTVNVTGDNAPVSISVPPSSEVKPVPYSAVAKYLGPIFRAARLL